MAYNNIRIAAYNTFRTIGIPFTGYTATNFSTAGDGSTTASSSLRCQQINYTLSGSFSVTATYDKTLTVNDFTIIATVNDNITYSSLDDFATLKTQDITEELKSVATVAYDNGTVTISGTSLDKLRTFVIEKTSATDYDIPYLNIYWGYTAVSGHTVTIERQSSCTITAPESYNNGDTFTATATANDGCIFNSPPLISYTTTEGTEKTVLFTISDDKKTATYSAILSDIADDTSSISVSGSASGDLVSFTQTLTNCTSNSSAQRTYRNTEKTITLTANTGYEFSENPTFTGGTATFTISNDKTTCTCVFTATDDCTLTATATIAEYAYTENLTNCTSDFTADTISYGKHTITLTANSGYSFESEPTVTGGTGTFTISSDKKTCTCVVSVTGEFIVTATAVKAKIPVVIKSQTNCTVTGVPTEIEDGGQLAITATANDGYYWLQSAKDATVSYYITSKEYITRYFSVNYEDNTIAVFLGTITNVADGYSVEINLNPTAKTAYIDKYGSVNVYNVTVENLIAFAQNRFIVLSSSDDSTTYLDLGDYVTDIQRVYVDVGETKDSTLQVMKYNLSDIAVKTPVDDIVTVDCGTITITGKNGNALDYNGSIKLMLPFVGFTNIDTDTALGKILHLYYNVNLLTGDAVATLEVDSVVMYHWTCKASQKIQFYTKAETQMVSTYDFESRFLYGFTPFALYTSNVGENANVSGSDSVRKQVSNCYGYFEMTELTTFSTENMNETERQQIIDLLASGVYYGGENYE